MRILVVEDHVLVREGLMLTLQALAPPGDTCAVLGAGDAEAATQLLGDDGDVDLVLLDLMLPGIGGVAFLGTLRKRFPQLPVVVLSARDDADTVQRTIRQGAAGFVSKASPTGTLLEALRAVLAGETWLPAEYREAGTKRGKTVAERYELTKMQAATLELLAEGKSNREIADLLGLTVGTVKIHVSAILKAMGVDNRSQALLIAQGKKLTT